MHRGIDFKEVKWVINFDMCRDAGAYTHRIGVGTVAGWGVGRAGVLVVRGLCVHYAVGSDVCYVMMFAMLCCVCCVCYDLFFLFARAHVFIIYYLFMRCSQPVISQHSVFGGTVPLAK